MGNYRIAVLPGDGIGKEVTSGAVEVLKAVGIRFGHEFTFEYGLIGGAAIDEAGTPLPEETLRLCRESDAVLLGAVGGPKWDDNPPHLRPEKGLLAIRKQLDLYANLRPVVCYDSLVSASPLKPDLVQGVDFVIVRELTGGIYFGQPSGRVVENGEEKAVDTLLYKKEEIERIVRMAFILARGRKKKVTSVDKANVLSSSRLWREVAEEVAKQFPDVTLEHMLVDNAAMQLIRAPKQFDVIVTENMFGDILSDEASMLSGSLGMLPSASLSASGPSLYEPVHGSAPDIAGMNKANPIAAILSAAMMLRLSFGLTAEAEAVEHAVRQALDQGLRTADLAPSGGRIVSTNEMVEEIKTAVLDYTAIAQIMTVYA
ncbi:3-isopropylmalate dehydrogenase [Geobacillus zalihae]|uniref:3-isopropylmalate dehydrogenase n=3 Tax=Bacteria TaxID=2 RepID=LEU3_GEOKA|nr:MULTISPECIES: 3-isopropylmalate dehydrogenase [Geobacillus]Q5KWJ4.1 RecName: Full=3-isopropylmalate dehydrogenase; AltName: Full=3-IPM-DH; AltName: Full=Beta-IPM dehydrogenase; Short=IMDH [Geobacillus kaustophilus HTA426]AGE23246.1 3-isopropylmalate dehydrogenase [Geobacillus sp. GHH01]AWO75215.1 3-isopropylmalate dehydrogenase [Geobacillus thermoleovorans]RXS86247.1 3-isopropylmalate dehydrogenase [Geobacillus sp. PK12]WKA46692.1 3-isopropylmalate dehydrogenase [Geobacillus zalihae]BAD769